MTTMSGMCKKMLKTCSCEMDKHSPIFMKKMWKMWYDKMAKHTSMMPHNLIRKGIKITILMALQERSLSGYAIMKHIEEKYGYFPHADVIYPTLQMLDDMGLVTKTEQDNKKVYAITDDGNQMLQDQRTAVEWLEWLAKRPKLEFEHEHMC